MPRSRRQSAAARRDNSENDARSVRSGSVNSVAGDSGADQVEAEVQQVPGAGDHGRIQMEVDDQPAAGAGARAGRGRGGPLLIPAPTQAARGVAPAQLQDAIDVASVTPLLKLVRSQQEASRMRQAELDRWHQHGKMFAFNLNIASFGEVPMTPGAQQKLLIWLKDTVAALAAYRATSLEHEELILQKLTDAILPPAKLTWNAAVETAEFQQPSMGARRDVGTASLTWRTLRAFLRCYDNPHGKDEMEQRLTNWTWGNTSPETQATFNELVDIWTQAAQQTATLDFARQVETPTQHAILNQIVRKMPQWAKKLMQDHPRKYQSVPHLWVSLKEEEACRLTRSSTSDVLGMPTLPQDLPTRASILTLAQAIIAEDTDGGEAAATVAQDYGDDTAPISLGLHFLGQQLPRGPNGEFECMRCGDTHWYRKCNAPASLEELAGQHHSMWPRVTPVVGNRPGAPPITQAPSAPTVGPTTSHYPRPGPAPTGSRAAEAPVSQGGSLQALARHMLDLQHRVAGRERHSAASAPSPSPPLLSLVSPAVASVSDSIIIEGPGVTVPLDYVPAGIYHGRRVWASPVMDDVQDGPSHGP